MLKRNETLIKTKFLQYLLPSIMTTVALQVGNVVDTILVGNILGTSAMSAVQISGTVLLVVQIPGWMLGVGGHIAVGNLLGKRDVEGARKLFSVSIAVTILSGIVFMLCAPFSNALAVMLAGDGALTGDVSAVSAAMLLGAPAIGMALQMMNYLAVDNNPSLATAYVVLSNVINLISDYFLLAHTPIGPAGAAWSTNIGYALALVILIPYARSDKRMLKLVNPFRGTREVLFLAMTTGVPSLLSIVCEVVRNWAMNIIIIRSAGEDAVAIYTVALNVIMICELFIGGVVETMSTIGGVLCGERDWFGLKSLSKNILIYCYGLLIALMTALFIFTPQVSAMFGIREGSLLDMTVTALRIFTLCLPFYAYNRFITLYYQTTGKIWVSNLIMILEYNAALLPVAILMAAIAWRLGLSTVNGIMVAFILGEALTAGIAVAAVLIRYKSGILVMPKEGDEEVLDMSVSCDVAEAVKVPVAIREFFTGKIDPVLSNKIEIAAEEMTVNIIQHGGETVKSIDVMALVDPDAIILRTRDSGINFDPTDYTCDSENYKFGGIEVVRKLADKVTYMRTLDFNNTTLEFTIKAQSP